MSASIVTTARVLIVDDEPMLRQFIASNLATEGYAVSTAENGREALDRILQQRPDVVLLDLAMPVMNGWELRARLRDLGLDIPVIFMSSGYPAASEAELHGATGYLAKPFSLDQLSAVIQRCLAGRREGRRFPRRN